MAGQGQTARRGGDPGPGDQSWVLERGVESKSDKLREIRERESEKECKKRGRHGAVKNPGGTLRGRWPKSLRQWD